MSVLQHYLIESLAPLVFRSGKPFGSQASAQDVIFPLPSAAAGLIRAMGIGQEKLAFNAQRVDSIQNEAYQKVLSVAVKGPFLVRYDDQAQYQILVPKPANALYFEDRQQGKIQLVRLAPQAFDADICGSDLPEGLVPVQMQVPLKGKPQSGVSFWSLAHVIRWQAGEDLGFEEVQTQGLAQLPIDIRTHVAIDSDSFAAQEGQLFQTASLDFNHRSKPEGGWESQRYGFVIQSQMALANDLATFGGERRLSHFKKVDVAIQTPATDQLLKQINLAQGFSLNFLSPAIFAQGYLPAWIDAKTFEGILPESQVRVKLKSVAIDRWLPVSGWDSLLWKPKAMRKAVAAGSVYWFELIDSMDLATLQALSNASISDHIQDQRDGFGVAIVSAWAKK